MLLFHRQPPQLNYQPYKIIQFIKNKNKTNIKPIISITINVLYFINTNTLLIILHIQKY